MKSALLLASIAIAAAAAATPTFADDGESHARAAQRSSARHADDDERGMQTIANAAAPGDAAHGWRYFSDPHEHRAVVISPDGEYFVSRGKGLRPVTEDFRKQVGSGVVALVGVTDGKAAVTVAVTPDLVGRFSAAELARAAVLAMGGQGAGGKPDFAQGGAPDGSMAQAGVDAVRAALA